METLSVRRDFPSKHVSDRGLQCNSMSALGFWLDFNTQFPAQSLDSVGVFVRVSDALSGYRTMPTTSIGASMTLTRCTRQSGGRHVLNRHASASHSQPARSARHASLMTALRDRRRESAQQRSPRALVKKIRTTPWLHAPGSIGRCGARCSSVNRRNHSPRFRMSARAFARSTSPTLPRHTPDLTSGVTRGVMPWRNISTS